MVAANSAIAPLLSDVDECLLQPPVNVLRLSLHPKGLAPQIVNLTEWRAHLLERLHHQYDASGDNALLSLYQELKSLPPNFRGSSKAGDAPHLPEYGGIVVPLKIRVDDQVLEFFSTTTVFGAPLDVTLAELAIEAFFPANEATADAMRLLTC